MSNVLGDNKQQQVLALGRLGWSLRRIEQATTVRRETASAYLKAAGIPVRERGGRPRVWPPKPATTSEVSTDPGPSKPATTPEVSTDSGPAKPAISEEVSTDPTRPSSPSRAPSASACEPYRELIAEALGRGRNAMAIWQDLVDDHGFAARYASVRRFVGRLRGAAPAEARVVITTRTAAHGFERAGADKSCAVAAVTLDLDAGDHELRQVCRASFDQWIAEIAVHLPWPHEVTRHAFATMIVVSLEGAFILARADRSGQAFLAAGDWLARLAESAPPSSSGESQAVASAPRRRPAGRSRR